MDTEEPWKTKVNDWWFVVGILVVRSYFGSRWSEKNLQLTVNCRRISTPWEIEKYSSVCCIRMVEMELAEANRLLDGWFFVLTFFFRLVVKVKVLRRCGLEIVSPSLMNTQNTSWSSSSLMCNICVRRCAVYCGEGQWAYRDYDASVSLRP